MVNDGKQLRTINDRGDLVVDGLHVVINAGHCNLNAFDSVSILSNLQSTNNHTIVDAGHFIVDLKYLVIDSSHSSIDSMRGLQNLSCGHSSLLC